MTDSQSDDMYELADSGQDPAPAPQTQPQPGQPSTPPPKKPKSIVDQAPLAGVLAGGIAILLNCCGVFNRVSATQSGDVESAQTMGIALGVAFLALAALGLILSLIGFFGTPSEPSRSGRILAVVGLILNAVLLVWGVAPFFILGPP